MSSLDSLECGAERGWLGLGFGVPFFLEKTSETLTH